MKTIATDNLRSQGNHKVEYGSHGDLVDFFYKLDIFIYFHKLY